MDFELLNTTMKATPPNMPVITPIGSSFGEIKVRASTSQRMIKILPPIKELRSKILKSVPIMIRNRCGIISPTKPITPATATQIPTNMDEMMNRIRIVSAELTPICCALLPPNRKAFNGRAKKYEEISPATDVPNTK